MLGFTQAEMAEKFKISTQAYRNKENNLTAFNDQEKMYFKKMLRQIFPNITIDDIFFS